jgi:hypothetical protein
MKTGDGKFHPCLPFYFKPMFDLSLISSVLVLLIGCSFKQHLLTWPFLSFTYFLIELNIQRSGMSVYSVVKLLPSICEALGSISSNTEKINSKINKIVQATRVKVSIMFVSAHICGYTHIHSGTDSF